MLAVRVRLKRGITAQYAGDEVSRIIVDLGNLQIPNASDETLAAYVDWADTTERRLGALFADQDYRQTLYTNRFWHLFNWSGTGGTGMGAKPFVLMLAAEKELQMRLLGEAKAELQRLRDWASTHHGVPVAVYDTNALIHYVFPDLIDWKAEIGEPAVHLVVPLIVIDELDRKRFGDSKTAQKARKAQKALWNAVGNANPGDRVSLQNLTCAVTIEVFIDERGHRRLSDPDDEIVDRAALMKQLLGTSSVRVVTGDVGVWLRASVEDLGVVRLNDKYSKDQPEPNPLV
jgi:hypothetical protein